MDYNAQHKNTTTEEEKKQIKKVLEKDHNYFKNTRPIKEGAYYEQKFKTKCLNCEAKFIKKSFNEWQKIKKELLELMQFIRENVGNKNTSLDSKGYFG